MPISRRLIFLSGKELFFVGESLQNGMEARPSVCFYAKKQVRCRTNTDNAKRLISTSSIGHLLTSSPSRLRVKAATERMKEAPAQELFAVAGFIARGLDSPRCKPL